jgi:hypothetical protein
MTARQRVRHNVGASLRETNLPLLFAEQGDNKSSG